MEELESPRAAHTEPGSGAEARTIVFPEAADAEPCAGKLRPVHPLEEGPLIAAAAPATWVNVKATMAAFSKLALVLAVLGLAWKRPNFFGTQVCNDSDGESQFLERG